VDRLQQQCAIHSKRSYEKLVKREKELDEMQLVRLRRSIPKEIPSYTEKDGIDLRIDFIPPEVEKT